MTNAEIFEMAHDIYSGPCTRGFVEISGVLLGITVPYLNDKPMGHAVRTAWESWITYFCAQYNFLYLGCDHTTNVINVRPK